MISHLTADFAPAQVGAGVAAYNAAVPGGVTPRSHAEVTALFDGLPLVPPGVVPVTEWRPTTPAHSVTPAGAGTQASTGAPAADLYAGIARIRPAIPASTTRLGVLIG